MSAPTSDPARAEPMPPSGLAGSALQRALHDLRGPLNTLAIVHEILRTADANSAPLTTAVRAVRNLGVMLDRLRAVADSRAERLVPVALTPALTAAVARAPRPSGVQFTLGDGCATGLLAASCPQRLDATLDTLLACAGGALPNGGTVRIDWRADGDHHMVDLRCEGAATDLPPANLIGKLDEKVPGAADWFRLACQAAGLAAELGVDGTATPPRITMRLPRA